jgi:hypothetical protein
VSRKLIINADGFGFTFGNNRGILECLAAGAVRSVSVNANFPAWEQTPQLAEQFPEVSVGIHLDLSVGPCVRDPKDIPDLVNASGQFLGPEFHRKALRGRIPHEQMVRELTAQVQRLREAGVSLTHWDSHQNQHLYPPFFRAAIEVAKRFEIPRMRTHRHYLFAAGGGRCLRAWLHLLTHPRRAAVYWHSRRMMRRACRAGMRMADRLISPGILDDACKYKREFWLALFDRLPEGVSEVYCHPGYPDETLQANATYVDERLKELEVLRDPAIAEEAERRGVELISFRQVRA